MSHLRDVLPTCTQRGIRIITNAGGVNPLGCRAAVEALASDLGVADRVKVAIVLGDDLFDNLDALLASGEPLVNMDTGQALSEIRARVLSANAYIGAAGIVKALEHGANVIITGRVADAAVTLAPMMHEFGWSPTDWDRLAAGVVAGHIIECGTQCTGGNFTDWPLVKTYRRMGFPLVEAEEDGSFVVTKHPNTGGLVSVHTVAEQILYEIGPPAYVTPDVVARFDSVRLEQEAPDRVRVTGARGEPAPAEAEGVDQLPGRLARLRTPSRLWTRGARQGQQGCRGVLGQRRRPRLVRPGACISSSGGTRATRRWRRASRARCWCSLRCAITTSGRSTRDSHRRLCRACSAPCRASPTSPIRAVRAPRKWSRSGRRWCLASR